MAFDGDAAGAGRGRVKGGGMSTIPGAPENDPLPEDHQPPKPRTKRRGDREVSYPRANASAVIRVEVVPGVYGIGDASSSRSKMLANRGEDELKQTEGSEEQTEESGNWVEAAVDVERAPINPGHLSRKPPRQEEQRRLFSG